MTQTQAPYRRHGTVKVPRKPGLEIHVSRVLLLPDTDTETDLLEIREYNTEAEIYGHGIVVPLDLLDDLWVAMDWVRIT